MPVIYTPKFQYQSLEQINSDVGRYYETPCGKVPSVTTILSAVPDDDKTEALTKWRNFVGDSEANRILKESGNVGTLVHKHLESYIKGEERPRGNNIIRKQSEKLSQVIIERGLSHVSEVWATEVPLYYPGLYAGTTDCVGVYKNKPAIIDFKNSRKLKTNEQVKDYHCQLAAYALAHNYIYGTDIETVVIMMVCRGDPNISDFGKYQEWVIEGADYENATRMWAKKLEQYYNQI